MPWLVGILATAVALWAAIAWQAEQPPLRGLENADPLTTDVAGALRLLVTFAAVGTVAALSRVVLAQRRRGRGPQRLDETGLDRLAVARHWALGWCAAALALVPFDAADTSGIAVGVAFENLRDFLLSTQTTQAWLLTAVVAFVLASVLPFVRTWRTGVALLAVAVLVQLAPVVTAQVSVGADHDLASDAAILATPLLALATGAALALNGLGGVRGDLLRRYHRVVGVTLLVALPARVLVGWFELAGEPWLAPGYGTSVVAALALLVLLAGSWVVRSAALRRVGPARVTVVVDAVLLLLLAGTTVVQSQLVPPRFRVPQTPQQNFLGYEVPDAPSFLALVQPGRVNLLLLVVSLGMIAVYLLGVRRLRRRGDTWPTGRTVAWVAGWLTITYVAVSEVWQYASTSFDWHMVVHMVFNMGAPALMVLAGPLTLLLRVRGAARPAQLLSLRDAVSAGLNARVLHVLGHPLVIWVLFVGSFYALYLTGLFGTVMKYHWAHQLMNVHFIAVGFLYYLVVIGIDSPGRPIPHIAKLGYILAAMPFHAFFAVAVLNSAVIGADYYSGLDLAWRPVSGAEGGTAALADVQQTGGQLAWGMGELPLLGVTIALLFQWFRSDERAARRFDRATSAGHDTSLDAYNEMLAELARRERESEQRSGRR